MKIAPGFLQRNANRARHLSLLGVMMICTMGAFCQQGDSSISLIGDVLLVRHDAETNPTFSGGHPGWLTFLENNLQANVATDNKAPKGEYPVMLDFVVDKNGHVRNIIPRSRYGYGMEAEAIRVLGLSRWKPARLKEQPVNAPKTITIIFVVAPASVLI